MWNHQRRRLVNLGNSKGVNPDQLTADKDIALILNRDLSTEDPSAYSQHAELKHVLAANLTTLFIYTSGNTAIAGTSSSRCWLCSLRSKRKPTNQRQHCLDY